MLRLRRGDSAQQQRSRIALRARGRDGVAEDAAGEGACTPRRLQIALVRLTLQNGEQFMRLDLIHWSMADRHKPIARPSELNVASERPSRSAFSI